MQRFAGKPALYYIAGVGVLHKGSLLKCKKFGVRHLLSKLASSCYSEAPLVNLCVMERVPSCFWHTFMLFYFSLLFVTAYGQATTPTPTSYANLTEVFPLLQGLQTPHPTRMAPGSQNFTQCCLLAVDKSYSIQNGLPVLNQPNYVGNLPWYTLQNDQFPCGATWNGNYSGAPVVTVPYFWCKSNCGGWQRSHNAVLSQWIQPFIGFILPAAVFCLNVREIFQNPTCIH